MPLRQAEVTGDNMDICILGFLGNKTISAFQSILEA